MKTFSIMLIIIGLTLVGIFIGDSYKRESKERNSHLEYRDVAGKATYYYNKSAVNYLRSTNLYNYHDLKAADSTFQVAKEYKHIADSFNVIADSLFKQLNK